MNLVGAPKSVVSTYFVPGFRVTKLPATVNSAAQPGTALPDDIIGDVVQAEVTRVCSGASQFSFTLNNYIATTTSTSPTKGAGGATVLTPTSLSGGTQPGYPPWKYNDFSLISFGDRLRIDMQDWRDPSTERRLSNTATYDKTWVPMVSGPVTDMRFEFSSGSGARVTVSGEDDLSQLKDHYCTRKTFPEVPERQIVNEVLKLAHYPLTSVADPQVPWPSFADYGAKGIVESILDGQSYLDFLQKLADRLDCEIFLEFSDLTVATSALEFHFEVSRCRVTPDQSAGDVFVLNRDRNLIEFSPSIKVVDQPSNAEVKGRDRDRNNPIMVTGTANPKTDPTLLKDELHPDDSSSPPQALVSGPLVRAHFFPNRSDNCASNPNTPNMDQARATVLAQAQLRRKAREFFTIEGTTVGLPRLRPGNFVQIKGMRPPFDGFYYVTKTVHSYGADGMRTKFSARRPGMVLPPYQER
jgi:hypothetical protein